MGTLTRQDYRNRIRDLGDDRSAHPRWQDAELDFWRRRGEIDIAKRIRHFLQIDTIATVASQMFYTFPADFIAIRTVRYLSGGTWTRLTYKDPDDFVIHRIDSGLTAGTPNCYTVRMIQDNGVNIQNIAIDPAPALGTDTIYIFYFRPPGQLTTDSTQTELPPTLEELPILYALSRLLRRVDQAQANDWLALYKTALVESLMDSRVEPAGDEYIRDTEEAYWPSEAGMFSRSGGQTTWY